MNSENDSDTFPGSSNYSPYIQYWEQWKRKPDCKLSKHEIESINRFVFDILYSNDFLSDCFVCQNADTSDKSELLISNFDKKRDECILAFLYALTNCADENEKEKFCSIRISELDIPDSLKTKFSKMNLCKIKCILDKY